MSLCSKCEHGVHTIGLDCDLRKDYHRISRVVHLLAVLDCNTCEDFKEYNQHTDGNGESREGEVVK